MGLDYYNLAIKRCSTREFKKKNTGEQQLEELKKHFAKCYRLLPDIEVEMMFLNSDVIPQMQGCAGYHDYMIEAPHYMLLLSSVKDRYLENAGYYGAEMILKLTALGLDSCWVSIGDEGKLREKLFLDTDKEAVVLIAFGYAVGQTSSRIDIKSQSDIVIKRRTGFVAPKLSIDHAIYEGDWGMESHISELPVESELYQAFIAACCAPSFLNLQPYRFIYDMDKVILVSLKESLTNSIDFRLNIGIVMQHFAAVISRQNRMIKGWTLGAPDKKYNIPEDTKIEGYFDI